MKNNKVLRTMAFVPAYMTKFLDKAIGFDTDALILDLEDSVPDSFKEAARENVRKYLDEGKFSQRIFIRVNSIDSGHLSQDLAVGLHENVEGFMFTKSADEHDIIYYDKLLGQLERDNDFEEGRFNMCPLIETASAVIRAYEMAKASSRMIALTFGGEDYLTDLGGLHKEHGTSLLVPRSHIVIAARAAGIDAIDTPYLQVGDDLGFKKEVEQARELGFAGNLIIHPSQIEIANRAFTPSDEEVTQSKRILAAVDESRLKGQGVTLLDGNLVGPPMEKRARAILAKMKMMGLE